MSATPLRGGLTQALGRNQAELQLDNHGPHLSRDANPAIDRGACAQPHLSSSTPDSPYVANCSQLRSAAYSLAWPSNDSRRSNPFRLPASGDRHGRRLGRTNELAYAISVVARFGIPGNGTDCIFDYPLVAP